MKTHFANLASKVYLRLALLKTGLEGHTLELVNQAIEKEISEGVELIFSDGSKLECLNNGSLNIVPQ